MHSQLIDPIGCRARLSEHQAQMACIAPARRGFRHEGTHRQSWAASAVRGVAANGPEISDRSDTSATGQWTTAPASCPHRRPLRRVAWGEETLRYGPPCLWGGLVDATLGGHILEAAERKSGNAKTCRIFNSHFTLVRWNSLVIDPCREIARKQFFWLADFPGRGRNLECSLAESVHCLSVRPKFLRCWRPRVQDHA